MDHVFYSWAAQAELNPITVEGAAGSWFWDDKGNRYLDFSSQLVNVNLGHQHPDVVAAIVDVSPNDVSRVLAALLGPGTPSLASGPLDPTVLAALLDPPGPGDPAAPTAPDAVPTASPSPTGGPGPRQPSTGPPPPSPTPVPPPPATGVPVLDDVVETVLDLLPPTPSPALPLLELPGAVVSVDAPVVGRLPLG